MRCSSTFPMARYSIEPWDRIFVKGYGFFSFGKNIATNIDKIIKT